MTIPLPTELTALARIFRDAGFPLYAVGGMVRNACLGLPVQDIDVTSPMPVSEARALLEARGVACREKGAFLARWISGLANIRLNMLPSVRRNTARAAHTGRAQCALAQRLRKMPSGGISP